MKKIENIAQLRAEIKLLEERSLQQKTVIKEDIKHLREGFKPMNLVANLIGDLTGVKVDSKSFLKDGFAYTVSLVVQQLILKFEKKFENKVYDVVDGLMERIKKFVNTLSDSEVRRQAREEERGG